MPPLFNLIVSSKITKFFADFTGRWLCLIKPKNQSKIDRMHQNAVFPHEFTRTVPSLANLSTFKATELKNLLCYTFLPSILPFSNSIPDAFHWAAVYVEIIRISSQTRIQLIDIEKLQKLINAFQKLIPVIMDEQAQTYSMHALAHLPDQIQRFGAIWAVSTFAFEGYCGHYARFIKSGTGILNQLNRRFLLLKESINFIRESTKTDSFISNLICKLFPLQKSRFLHKSKDDLVVMSEISASLPNGWKNSLASCFGTKNLKFSGKISVNGTVYQSSSKHSSKSCLVRGTSILTPHSMDEGDYRVCIQFFIFDGSEYFAASYIYAVLEDSICSLAPEPCLPDLKQLYRSTSYGSFFKLCALSTQMCFLAVSSIQCKMILYPYDEQTCFLTDALPFEHD